MRGAEEQRQETSLHVADGCCYCQLMRQQLATLVCGNEAINTLQLQFQLQLQPAKTSCKKAAKSCANELIHKQCMQKVNITTILQGCCLTVCVCVRLKDCSCRRLARIKQRRNGAATLIADANSKKCATSTACEFLCLCA